MIAFLSNIVGGRVLGAVSAFLATTMGKVALALLLAAVWTFIVRHDAADDAISEAEVAKLESRIETLKQQVALSEAAAAKARVDADTTQRENAQLEAARDDLIETLADDGCTLPDDLRDRLFDIK